MPTQPIKQKNNSKVLIYDLRISQIEKILSNFSPKLLISACMRIQGAEAKIANEKLVLNPRFMSKQLNLW